MKAAFTTSIHKIKSSLALIEFTQPQPRMSLIQNKENRICCERSPIFEMHEDVLGYDEIDALDSRYYLLYPLAGLCNTY